jgi:hypothetical protein
MSRKIPISELKARGRELKRLKTQKPPGVTWKHYVKAESRDPPGRRAP